jgi:hypothetical protein
MRRNAAVQARILSQTTCTQVDEWGDMTQSRGSAPSSSQAKPNHIERFLRIFTEVRAG